MAAVFVYSKDKSAAEETRRRREARKNSIFIFGCPGQAVMPQLLGLVKLTSN
jgi:hypothetical protein